MKGNNDARMTVIISTAARESHPWWLTFPSTGLAPATQSPVSLAHEIVTSGPIRSSSTVIRRDCVAEDAAWFPQRTGIVRAERQIENWKSLCESRSLCARTGRERLRFDLVCARCVSFSERRMPRDCGGMVDFGARHQAAVFTVWKLPGYPRSPGCNICRARSWRFSGKRIFGNETLREINCVGFAGRQTRGQSYPTSPLPSLECRRGYFAAATARFAMVTIRCAR